jgi:hypothetical protein
LYDIERSAPLMSKVIRKWAVAELKVKEAGKF